MLPGNGIYRRGSHVIAVHDYLPLNRETMHIIPYERSRRTTGETRGISHPLGYPMWCPLGSMSSSTESFMWENEHSLVVRGEGCGRGSHGKPYGVSHGQFHRVTHGIRCTLPREEGEKGCLEPIERYPTGIWDII